MYILLLTLYLICYFVLPALNIKKYITTKYFLDTILHSCILPIVIFISGLMFYSFVIIEEPFIISGIRQQGLLDLKIIAGLSFIICTVTFVGGLIKAYIATRNHNTLNIYTFVIEQFILIYFISVLAHLMYVEHGSILNNSINKTLIFVIGLIFATLVSSKVLELILKRFKLIESTNLKKSDEIDNDLTDLSLGSIIGLIERSLFFVSFVSANLMSIPVVLAAKAFYRFGAKDKVDYYIVGNLLSILLSIISYYIYLVLLNNY